MSAERYVPVSELPTFADFDPEVHRMSWDFSLPPTLDTERIFLDQRRLRRLQKVAAFSSNHVSEYRGDRSEYDVTIAGIHADGTAIAGRAKLKEKVEIGQLTMQDELSDDGIYRRIMSMYFKTAIFHHLNKTEIQSRVADAVHNGGNPREKIWADELNSALMTTMKTAARQHLIDRETKVHRIVEGVVMGWGSVIAAEAVNEAKPITLGMLLSVCAATWMGSLTIDSIFCKNFAEDALLTERRWTLNPFGTWQPDRYLATVALNSVAPLIRYRK